MRYEKPIVMNLSARARTTGQGPLGCVAGDAAGAWETCATGGNPYCSAPPSCVSGGAATPGGDCLSGTTVSYYCEAGSGGANDRYGCNVGPAYGPS
jgi:hypothetical protein